MHFIYSTGAPLPFQTALKTVFQLDKKMTLDWTVDKASADAVMQNS